MLKSLTVRIVDICQISQQQGRPQSISLSESGQFRDSSSSMMGRSQSMMTSLEKSSSFLGVDRNFGVSVIFDDNMDDDFGDPLKIYYKR